MPADQDTITRLEKQITSNLETISYDLYRDWIIRTVRIEPTTQCVAQVMGAAQSYRTTVESFQRFRFEWVGFGFEWGKLWIIPLPVNARWPLNIDSPRQKLRDTVRMIERLGMEIAKDVEQTRDIVSIIKANDGSCRFYDEVGGAIVGLYANEWPNDRLAADAEIIATRYLMTQDDVTRYKQDLEAWLTRRIRGCPADIKQRLGARRL